MRTLAISIVLGSSLFLFGQTSSLTMNPTQVLYDHGVLAEEQGRPEQAKLYFRTLAGTYDGAFADKAKVEIGALYIFEEAQDHLRAGQLASAYDSYHFVARVYPESPLAKLCNAEMAVIPVDNKQRR
jgi:outer membrane protein assembly factor BamD (BamD/ComL family)